MSIFTYFQKYSFGGVFFFLLITGGFLFTPALLKAQLTTNCDNSNFNNGTLKGWDGCYGMFDSQCVRPGFHLYPDPIPNSNYPNPLHKLIQAPGWQDHNTCDGLNMIFPGEAFVARLGDTVYNGGLANPHGKEAEMSYGLTVTSSSYLFIYRYAVVLQSGNHDPDIQPDFQVMITDELGNVLDSTCGYYYISAQKEGAPHPGWNLCEDVYNGDVYWKDWTTVGMDLSTYLGQSIFVKFKVRGCVYETHFGYAYISAYCSYLMMHTALCEGDSSAVLTAPPGFSYLWNTITGDTSVNGDTTASIIVPHPVTGTVYSCTLTAANGCVVTISQELTYTVIHSNFTFTSSCAGLPIQFTDSSYVNQNNVTAWKWDFGDGTPVITGVPNPIHTYSDPGTYQVFLRSYSTEGCRDSITKTIVVDSLPNVTNAPMFKQICSNAGTAINLTSDVTGTGFTWTATASSPNITGFSNSPVTPALTINQVLINTGITIDTVFYAITPHKNTCDGFDTIYKVAVNPFPMLTNIPLSKSICDSTATGITLLSNNDSTKFTWVCVSSSPNLSGYSNNTTVPTRLINHVIHNSGYTTETVTYRIIPKIQACVGDTTNFVVTVFPKPDLSNTPPSKTICSNTPTNITLTSHTTGAQFTWTCSGSSPNVSGFSNNAVPTTTLNQTLINTGTNIETVTYNITPKANGCNGFVFHYIVTVNPVATLSNTPLHKEICNNTATNISLTSPVAGTLFTWTCTASSGNLGGFSNVSVPTGVLNQTLTNNGFTTETVTYLITPIANSCPGTVASYVVSVYPVPDLSNSPPSLSICKGASTNLTLTSNVTGTLFTWTCTPSSGNVTGYSNNAVPTATLNQTLNNSGIVPETVTYHLTPVANGCTGIVTDFVVTVNPKPTVTNNPMSKTICSESQVNIPLTATCTGTSYTWQGSWVSGGTVTGFTNGSGGLINDVLINSTSTPGVMKYKITATVGGCTANDTNYYVTVNPTPHVTNTPLVKTICSGGLTGINLTADVTGTTFTWTATPSSGNVTGYANGNTAAISQTLVNSGYTMESVVYHITPTAFSCPGAVYNYTVNVNPVADAYYQPGTLSVCTGQTAAFNILSHVSGATFTWTASASSGLVTGFVNGSGNSVSQVLTSTSTNIETVTYTVIPTINGCQGTQSSMVVSVKPSPSVTATPSSLTICSQGAAAVSLTSNVSGTTFAWTATGSSPNLSGFANGTGNSFSQNVTNSGYTIETVTYTITPTANACNGTAVNFVLTVNPVPDLSNTPAAKQICTNSLTNIPLTSHVTGTLFTWTATGSSAGVTGFSTNLTPSALLNQTLVNSGYNIETVTYHLTPIANGCPGPVTDYVVTVMPRPDLSNSPKAKQICNNSQTGIALTTNVSGTLFTWTATPSSGSVTGYVDNTLTPTVTLNQTLVNSGYNIETVIYHITPHANACDGTVTDYTVTVYPTPNLSNSPASKQICNNQLTNVNLTSNVAGTLFTWTASGSSASVTGFSNNVTPASSINHTLVNSGYNIETVTYQVTPTANGCLGPITPYVVTVYPTADVYFTPSTLTICSENTAILQLASHVANPSFTWTASGSSPNVSGFSNGGGNTISQALTNSGTAIETVSYQVTPTANSCVGTSSSIIVTVNPKPLVTTTPLAKTLCSGLNTGITLTSGVSGTTFAWIATPSAGTLSGFTNGNGSSISHNLVNSGYTIETVTYAITPTANGCAGPTANYVVTVNPVPDLSNNPPASQICNNMQTNVTLNSHVAGTLFTWTTTASSPSVSGYSNNSTPTTLLNQTLVNAGFTNEWVIYHVTPHANGCDGPVTDYTVTLVSKPDLTNSPLSKQICNGTSTNITLTSNVTGTLFTWTTTPSSGNVSGYANNATPTTTLSQTLSNSGFVNESVIYHVLPAISGCTGDVTDYTVTVYPTPNLSNSPAAKQICNNQQTNVSLTSNVTGTLFTWTATGSTANVTGFSNNATPASSINHTLVNSGYNIETVTYQVTPTANGCPGPVTPYVVTVYPTADVYFTPATLTICSQNTAILQLASHVANPSFTWTASASSINVTGYSNGSGNLISQVLTNSGTTIETVTYQVTPTANSCVGTSSSIIVTVNPKPLVTTTPLAKTLCSGLNTGITLTSGVSGTTFAWIATPSAGTLSGFSNGSGSSISHNLANSGYTIETVTYAITPTANGCIGPASNYVVTVNPVPDVSNNPLSTQICSGTSPNIALTSNVAGTNFSWTTTSSSPNVSGYSNGSGTFINQVLTNSGFTVETVTYHLTPTANSCDGLPKDYIVTIVSVPDVYFQPSAQTICNQQMTSIQNLSHVPGATFTWTVTASSPNISGYSNSNGNVISQTLYNSGTTTETATYTVAPMAFGCPPGLPQTVVVTIQPKPIIQNAITTSQICSATATGIVPQSSVPGSNFSWTATGSSGNVSGFTNGMGLSIVQTLTNSGYNIEGVTYNVTPTANSCPGDAVPFTVTVFPVADVYSTPSSQAFCSGGSCNLTLASHVAGPSFTWTASGSSGFVTGYYPGSGNLVQQVLTNSGTNVEVVTYSVTPSANGCTGTSGNTLVSVNPLPVLAFTPCWDPVMTTGAKPLRLKGATPTGGTYSGTGVSMGFFYPTVAGSGTHLISYNYSNTFTCAGSTNQSITVVDPVPFTCGNMLTDIRDFAQYPTVDINGQCWTTTNLTYGTSISSGTTQRDNCIPSGTVFVTMS